MATTERPYSLKGKRVWVAGHRGMVGSAICRRLQQEDCEILTAGREDLDLTRQGAVQDWMVEKKPDAVFIAAAKVGGILANSDSPADFIYDNLAIELNIIEGARQSGVEKLLFLGSTCIYPKLAPQPMQEEALLTGPLEPSNQWYAIAKISGIKLCQAYRLQYGLDFNSAMPTNLYGSNDNFHPTSSHVLPALIRRIYEAKVSGAESVVIWGSGTPTREFLHADDCADALVHIMQHYSDLPHINVGTGREISIKDLAALIGSVIGFEGGFEFDTSKPDGTPRKVSDVSKLRDLGWEAQTKLRDGIAGVYTWYLAHEVNAVA